MSIGIWLGYSSADYYGCRVIPMSIGIWLGYSSAYFYAMVISSTSIAGTERPKHGRAKSNAAYIQRYR